MLNYNEFILENKLSELILEGALIYNKNFTSLLMDMHTKGDKISGYLLDLYKNGTDIALSQNFISLTKDKNDSIDFIPEKKPVDRKVITEEGRFYPLEKYMGLFNINPKKFMKELPRGTTGEIIETKPHPTGKIMYGVPVVLAHFISDGGKECILNQLALSDVPVVVNTGSMNVGRFANRILTSAGIDFTPKDIENFVNAFKAEYDIKKNDVYRNLRLVSGEDIRKYYYEGNYYSSGGRGYDYGPLWSSCMRYKNTQSFLDIYVANPDKVQLLVLFSDNDKVMARALVWKLDQDSRGFLGRLSDKIHKVKKPDKYFMDRIYTTQDNQVNLFINYAKQNGWLYKIYQSSSRSDISEKTTLKCTVDNHDFRRYPYMDTFHYMTDFGLLTTSEDLAENSKYYYYMKSVDGNRGECRGKLYKSSKSK